MDVNARDDNGWNPLHLAAENGHKEIAELLIDKGANVNAKAINGGTPLDCAKVERKQQVADFIYKQGGKTEEQLSETFVKFL